MTSKILSLSYVVWGLPLRNISSVSIPFDESGFELKSMISKQLSLAPIHFSLHKMCLILPEETVYPDEVVDIQTMRTVSYVSKVGDVFRDALPNNCPHVGVRVSDSTWMAEHIEKIELSCLISGGTSTSDFKVTISHSLKIVDLKARIKEAQSILKTAELASIELYDVCIPAYDMKKREEALRHFIPSKAQLADSLPLYRIFAFPPPSHIHVIVKLSGRLRLELPTRNLADRREEYYNAVHQYPVRIVPSSTTQPNPFHDFQRDPRRALHCNRGSIDNATPPLPLTLLHPVFGTFMEDCRTLIPKAEDNLFAAEFISTMRMLYAQEDTRDDERGRAPAVRNILAKWGVTFPESYIETAAGRKYSIDGDMLENVSGCHYAILEVKNEIGSGNAEPYAQACLYYQQACMDKFRKTASVFPCLLILVYGPHIAFAGAAWNEHPTMEILSVVPLFHDPYFPSNAEIQTMVARHLLAMKQALQTLSDYYQNSYSLHDPFPAQLFPYATSYLDGNQSQQFEYLEQIRLNLIFRGRLLGIRQDSLWIKFVRSYSPEAHRFCQEKGHAPKLLGVENLAGQWIMVVMEDLSPNYHTLDKVPKPLPVSLLDGIRQTIEELHQAGFVHGDVRDLNIMVHQQYKNKFMIVDWDWSGVNRVARYPPNVNQAVKRPPGATDGEPILPDHDLKMLELIQHAYWGEKAHKRPPSATAGEELSRKVQRTDPL